MWKMIIFLVVIICSIGNKELLAGATKSWDNCSKKVRDICNAVEDLALPSEDLIDNSNDMDLKKCDAEELYYGFKNQANYVRSRYCAIKNQKNDILAMIYANGKGVKNNINLAIHFTCFFGGSVAELEGRIAYLQRFRKKKTIRKDFNICDFATTRDMMAYCASLNQNYAEARKKKILLQWVEQLSTTEQKIFQKLIKESEHYFTVRVKNELDRYGSGAIAEGIEEGIILNQNMISLFDKTMRCQLKQYTLFQFRQSDNRLNVIYRTIQKNADNEFIVTKDGVKRTERAWIKYKEMWVQFARMRCPLLDENTWKVLLTEQRIKELESLVVL